MTVPEAWVGNEDGAGPAGAVGARRADVARHVEGVEGVVARVIADLAKSAAGKRDLMMKTRCRVPHHKVTLTVHAQYGNAIDR